VAFDVYQAAGGGYLVRCLMMLMTTAIFFMKIGEQQVRLMSADGTLWSWREWLDLLKYTFRDAKTHHMIWPWLSYFSPNFHPWQHDNRPLIDTWKQEFASSPVYRSSVRKAT
jgi:uncharacterized protein